MLNYNNETIKNNNCTHKCVCNINKYGQCIYKFVLYCQLCKYGLRNIYDKCKNTDCYLYMKNNTILSVKNDTIENSTEDNLEEDNLSKNTNTNVQIDEYFHIGDCIFKVYNNCKQGCKYFCSCE